MSDPTPSGTVPPAAVHWILETVCAHMMNSPRKNQMLNTMLQNPHYGIEQLNLDHLKKVCVAIRQLQPYDQSHHDILKGFQGARKAHVVQRIRRCFYADYPICQVPSAVVDRLASSLSTSAPSSLPRAAAPAAAAAHATPTVATAAASASATTAAAMKGSHKRSAQYTTPMAAMASAALDMNAAAAHRIMTNAAIQQYGSSSSSNHATPLAAAAAAAADLNHQSAVRSSGHAQPPQQPHHRSFAELSASAAAAAATARGGGAPGSFASLAVAPPTWGNVNGGGGVAAAAAAQNVAAAAASHFQQQPSMANRAAAAAAAAHPFFHHNGHAAFGGNAPMSAGQRPPSTYIKQEGASRDPDSVPQSEMERAILGQLQQMSFTDPREILRSLRHLTRRQNGRPPSVDDVMFDIIAQREAAEEAMQMDAARLQSEQSRKTDAAQRRQQIQLELQVRMETSTVDTWMENGEMFPNSWMLSHAGLATVLRRNITTDKSRLKDKLIELLKLERDARKWYREMPKTYFERVIAQRLMSSTDMVTVVQNEIDTLTRVMYNMSEQVGGVPKAFRDAHDAALASSSSSNGANETDNNRTHQANGHGKKDDNDVMDVDDDVVLLPSPSSLKVAAKKGASSAASSSSPTTPQEGVRNAAMDVIDLCNDDSDWDFS